MNKNKTWIIQNILFGMFSRVTHYSFLVQLTLILLNSVMVTCFCELFRLTATQIFLVSVLSSCRYHIRLYEI
jgi:hypothetical protein